MLKRRLSLFLVVFCICFVYAVDDVRYSNVANLFVRRAGVAFSDRFRADIYNEHEMGRTAINIDLGINKMLNEDLDAKVSFYRFTEEFVFDDSSLTVGLQGVPFGVCKLWNPTDKFNPVYALSLEPEYRQGVFGVNYRYYLQDLSYFQIVGSIKDQNQSEKIAVRWKGFVEGNDIGLTYVLGEEISMAGVDHQMNVGETGIEFRTEAAYTNDRSIDKKFWSVCSGFEYAFPWMLTMVAEYYYSGASQISLASSVWNSGSEYLGVSMMYALDLLTSLALTGVVNLDDNSMAGNVYISHSLTQESTLDFGAALYFGEAGTEFKANPKSLFFRISNWF